MTLFQKFYLFLISEFSWKEFVTRNEINQFLFVTHAVDVLAYVLRVVWWLWSTANLFKCSNGLRYRRQPPRLVNLHSFGLVASLVNTLPKRPPYATELLLNTIYNTEIYNKPKNKKHNANQGCKEDGGQTTHGELRNAQTKWYLILRPKTRAVEPEPNQLKFLAGAKNF